jgi:hypothetical protein
VAFDFVAGRLGNQFTDVYELSLPHERLNEIATSIEHEAEISDRQHKACHGITWQAAEKVRLHGDLSVIP